MEKQSSTPTAKCPGCSQKIVINQVWYPGGVNDYGSFILECNKCKHIFEVNVGRDVDASSVEDGAKFNRKEI